MFAKHLGNLPICGTGLYMCYFNLRFVSDLIYSGELSKRETGHQIKVIIIY